MPSFVSQPYRVIPLPGNADSFPPVSVAEFKLWAKVPGIADDAIIEMIINGVTLEVEKYTKREITIKAFQTSRNNFGDINETPIREPIYFTDAPVVLRRTPLVSVTSISYLSGGSFVALDLDDIDIIESPDFYSLVPAYGKVWKAPDRRLQSVVIEFIAGYESADQVPEDLKFAILAHATSVYQNRGDCDSGGGSCSCKFAPAQSMAVYNRYRIIDFRG